MEADGLVEFKLVISLHRHIPEKRYSIKSIAQMGWRYKKWEILINLIAEAH